ncbi:MAG: KTSC domain-containing protein [Anaerolineae bacterium]|jgi:hypothetical protein
MDAIDRVRVNSTNLLSLGYDAETRTLEIEFHTRKIYRYYNVPPIVVRQLMDAPSLGEFFNFHIKDVYRWRRMR